MRGSRISWLLLLGAGSCSTTGETDPPVGASERGMLTLFLENDIVVERDDNYSSGLGASWASPDVATLGQANIFRKLTGLFEFLPTFGDEGYQSFASLTLGQEMYTPTDIESPVPPPDQHPYAGVLFLDTGVHSRGQRSLHTWNLRLGVVGPSSGAAEIQEILHGWTGSPIPQGWDNQLANEPLLNLDYQYSRRLLRHAPAGAWGYDLATNAGGGLGNYYIGANAGLQARLGLNLPDSYGEITLRNAGGSLVGMERAGGFWRAYLYLGGQLFGIARFLPSDGNTFQDSPSVDRDDFFGNFSGGLVLGAGRCLFTYSYTNLGGLSEFPLSDSNNFGTVSLSYVF